MRRLVLPGVGALLLATVLGPGCDPTYEDLKKKHGPKLEETISKLEKVKEVLLGTPPLRTDDEKIQLRHPEVSFRLLRDFRPRREVPNQGNAIFMTGEAFADLTEHGHTEFRMLGENLLNTCASLLRHGRCPASPFLSFDECGCRTRQMANLFELCERVQYLFVVKTIEFRKPSKARWEILAGTTPTSSDGGSAPSPGSPMTVASRPAVPTEAKPDAGAPSPKPASATDARVERGRDSSPRQTVRWTYKGGVFVVEIHVFNLEGAAPSKLGAFRVRVESPETVTTRSPIGEEILTRARGFEATLEGQFKAAVKRTLEAEISRRLSAKATFAEVP
jgi:hypothetical protein